MSLLFNIAYNRARYKRKNGFQSRPDVLAKMINDSLQSYPFHIQAKSNIIEVLIGDLRPFDNRKAYSISTEKYQSDLVFPDPHSVSWPEIGVECVQDYILELHEIGKQDPLYSKAIWIGANTHQSRKTFIDLIDSNEEYKKYIDAWFYEWDGKTQFMSLQDQVRDYKYLIDIEGVGFSGRLKYQLCSNRAVFVVDRPHWDWATCDCEPWVHYIPVKRDCSDLLEKIKWAEANPQQVENICERSSQFMLSRLSLDNINKTIHDKIEAKMRITFDAY